MCVCVCVRNEVYKNEANKCHYKNAVLHLEKQAFDSQLFFRIEMQWIKRYGCVVRFAKKHRDRKSEIHGWWPPVYGGERQSHRIWPSTRMSTEEKLYGFHTSNAPCEERIREFVWWKWNNRMKSTIDTQ